MNEFTSSKVSPLPQSWHCKAVLFDMDGVLLDTEPLYTLAYDEVMQPFGAQLDRVTKLEIMGRAAAKSALHVIEKFALPLTPEEFLERRKPILKRLFANAPSVPGAEEFVRSLVARGLPLAVATSTDRALFELKTAKIPWFELFDAVVCGDEVTEPKPAPEIFLTAAAKLGVEPESCAIFEDSPSGVAAASAAGGRVFALVREPTDLSCFAGADHVIEAFSQARF